MLYTVNYILSDIEKHLKSEKPFSLVRVGDGDLKLLDSLVKGNINKVKFNRSGIPENKLRWLLRIYRRSCNNANYTSSFEMYYSDKFWVRKFSPGTKNKVQNWKELYNRVGITNNNYCNPEIGFLLFLRNEKNLLDVIKDKKICLITCFSKPEQILKNKGFDVRTILIPKIGSGHYSKYKEIVSEIKGVIPKVDIFLIGAGALGKGYALVIKNSGGIAIDIGQVMNVWNGTRVPNRFKGVLSKSRKHLTFSLTNNSQKYREFF